MSNREFTQEEADTHNALTEEAWGIIDPLIILKESAKREKPSWLERRRLNKAILLFEQALKINSTSYSSMWALGKIFQKLGDLAIALEWFEKSHQENPENPDVVREAGLCALDLGKSDPALRHCRVAVELSPNDPGLLCNLALAYMISGDDQEALSAAKQSAERDPDDSISKAALKFIEDVAHGRRNRPKTLLEAFPR